MELELRTEQMWEHNYERVIVLTVTGISHAPFVLSSVLILGNSDRIRWARNFTKYGLIVVIIALVVFQVYYLVEVYNAREQVRTFQDDLMLIIKKSSSENPA